MDRIINKLTERLTGVSSRRSFMRTLGKITVGGAGAIAALVTGTRLASAAPLCCSGTACSTTNACPYGTYLGDHTYCCTAHDCKTHVTVCNNCYFLFGGQSYYYCTYTTVSSSTCPC
jgi:hypothetical protein